MDATVAANVAGVSLSPLFPPPTSPPFLPSASLLSPRHIFLLSTLVEFSPSLPPPLPLLRPSLFHPLSRLPAFSPFGEGIFFQEISVHGDDSCRRGGDTAHGLCRLDKLVAPLSLLLGWPRMRISGRGNHCLLSSTTLRRVQPRRERSLPARSSPDY